MKQLTDTLTSLESKMVQYRDLIDIPVRENGEGFVILPISGEEVIGQYQGLTDMQAEFPQIPVRQQVCEKLERANFLLQKKFPSFQLVITYGYRSPKIQQEYFQRQKTRLLREGIPEKLVVEATHRLIAVPEVAGHPTGGAVDVSIFNRQKNVFLDFGTEMYNFSTKDCYTFSPNISEKSKENRGLLRSIMLVAGFAPFDGEWWHFSYGDKEWAYYYKTPRAIYCQISEESISKSILKVV